MLLMVPPPNYFNPALVVFNEGFVVSWLRWLQGIFNKPWVIFCIFHLRVAPLFINRPGVFNEGFVVSWLRWLQGIFNNLWVIFFNLFCILSYLILS